MGLAGPGTIASFTYDAFGRRGSKEINGQLAEYLYDGAHIVQEVVEGTPVSYLRSLNIDEALVREGGEHYLADALGSAIALTEDAGDVQTGYTYEPFGRTTVTGASTNRFQYTGRENGGTGLYYYRARYYSPILHRFISEDPLISATKTYTYANGNPVTALDPLGLFVIGLGGASTPIDVPPSIPPGISIDKPSAHPPSISIDVPSSVLPSIPIDTPQEVPPLDGRGKETTTTTSPGILVAKPRDERQLKKLRDGETKIERDQLGNIKRIFKNYIGYVIHPPHPDHKSNYHMHIYDIKTLGRVGGSVEIN